METNPITCGGEASAISPERLFVRRLKAGDAAAFDELVRGFGPRMLAVASRFFDDRTDAEDAVQDAFLHAFRGLERFEEGARLGTWLHRIVVNAALMKLRARRRRPEQSLDELLAEAGPRSRPGDALRSEAAAASSAETGEERARVRRSIRALPADARDVLVLRDLEQLETAETARLLGISVPAVKTRLHRARAALAERLGSGLVAV